MLFISRSIWLIKARVHLNSPKKRQVMDNGYRVKAQGESADLLEFLNDLLSCFIDSFLSRFISYTEVLFETPSLLSITFFSCLCLYLLQ